MLLISMLFVLNSILFKGIKIFAICLLQILATKHASIDDRAFEQLLINLSSKNQNISSFCFSWKPGIPPDFAQNAPSHAEIKIKIKLHHWKVHVF